MQATLKNQVRLMSKKLKNMNRNLQISRKLKRKLLLPRRLRNNEEEPKENALEMKLHARN